MNGWTLLLAIVVAGCILFVWSGISQNLPWGIKSVKTDVKNEEVTQAIANEGVNSMMYFQGEIVALVAAKPKAYYSPKRFFGIELVTQFLVGGVLCLLLAQLPTLSLINRQLVVFLASLLIVVTTDIPYCNWWGFSVSYTLGVAINKLLGLQLTSLIISLLFWR